MHKEKAPLNRFEGEGVDFKAKLIGHEEVAEPRGDKICVDTMNKLKFIAQQNLRGSGIHKPRIILNINLTGLQILDEKSRAVLHQHHVHRISFISRDPNDARAFGYIYGKDDGKHEYFGIKTMQAADQVVTALKDLFQVVYELKKKEIEGTEETAESKEEEEASVKTNKTDSESGGASGTADLPQKPEEKKEDNLLDMFGGLGLSKESPTSAPEPWNTPTPQSNPSAHPAFPVSFDDDKQQAAIQQQQTQQPQQPQQQQKQQNLDQGMPTFKNPPPFENLDEDAGGSALAFKPVDLPTFNDPFKTTNPPIPSKGTGISSQPIFSASSDSAFNAFPAPTTNSMIGSMNTTNAMPFNSNPASGTMNNMNNFGFGNAPAFGGPPAFNNTSFMQMNNHQPFPVQQSGPPPVPQRNTTQPENVLQPTVGAISDPFSSLDPLGKPEKTMFKKNSPSINDMQTSTAPLAQNSVFS
ncbi:DgyrCDS956 [Dimorphilus gyrociliatus]|uniref:DgyrCDS956 n=1 Tax=Dimorphilus gyrociliatus TaxID=2664684 RepID=A0A7I8V8Z0_9ANNE|nr:DgyrCDS956 [Dimorphilus gyrociliatus]